MYMIAVQLLMCSRRLCRPVRSSGSLPSSQQRRQQQQPCSRARADNQQAAQTAKRTHVTYTNSTQKSTQSSNSNQHSSLQQTRTHQCCRHSTVTESSKHWAAMRMMKPQTAKAHQAVAHCTTRFLTRHNTQAAQHQMACQHTSAAPQVPAASALLLPCQAGIRASTYSSTSSCCISRCTSCRVTNSRAFPASSTRATCQGRLLCWLQRCSHGRTSGRSGGRHARWGQHGLG